MNQLLRTALILCAVLGVSAWADVAPEDAGDGADSPALKLLARLPAKDADEQGSISASLIELGPEAVKEICRQLVPPGTGDDTQARYALDGLSTYVHRPGAERERLLVAGSYIQALELMESDGPRAFLIRQLERIGRDESLAVLAEYLTDPRLGEPAARALVAIGTPGAAKRLRLALSRVEGIRRATIINGLGSLRDEAATRALLREAASEHGVVRDAALAALATIGHPSAESVLAGAAREGNEEARARGAQLYLLYARRLAESGREKDCAAICRELIEAWSPTRRSNIACVALSTLVEAVGEAARDDLLAAVKAPGEDLRGVALRLAPSIPGKDYTGRWVEALSVVPPDARAGILAMLGRRGDRSALPAVRQALHDEDPSVKLVAIEAVASLENQRALTILLGAITEARGEEKAQLLAMLDTFGGQQALRAVVAAAASEEAAVRDAAIRTLAAWPEPDALEHLLVIFRSRDDAGGRGLLLRGYMRLAQASGRSREAVLELYKDALSAARSADEKKTVLGGLARLKTSESLALVLSLLDSKELEDVAARAVVSIVEPRRRGRGALRGPDAVAALERVIAVTDDADLRRDAREVLARITTSRR